MKQQHQQLKRYDVLSAIGKEANGKEISTLKVTEKADHVARGFGFKGQVCIVLELKTHIVGYRFFSNKSKDKVNEYIHLFFSNSQVMEEFQQ